MQYISKAQMKRVMWVSLFCLLMMFLTAQFTFIRGVLVGMTIVAFAP